MDRRNFLKIIGSGAASAATGNLLTPGRTFAKDTPTVKEFYGILVDTTRCIGCRRCEKACAEANGLPVPDISESKNADVLKTKRKTTDTEYTIINSYDTEKGKFFVPKRWASAMSTRTVSTISSNVAGCPVCIYSSTYVE